LTSEIVDDENDNDFNSETRVSVTRHVTHNVTLPYTDTGIDPQSGCGSSSGSSSEKIPAALPRGPSSSGSLPASERLLWGADWLHRYESAIAKSLGRPWAFDRRQLTTLEKVVGTFCQDKTRIGPWVERAASEFGRATQSQDPALWSSHQPKGLLRWFNEGRPGYVPKRASAPPTRPADAVSVAETPMVASEYVDALGGLLANLTGAMANGGSAR
jgi:hypothetical protein